MHECVMSLMEHILFCHSILASSEFWLLLKFTFFFGFFPRTNSFCMPSCHIVFFEPLSLELDSSCRWLRAMCVSWLWFCEWESTPFIIIPISYPRCEGNYPPLSNCCRLPRSYTLYFLVSTSMCLLIQRQKSFWGPKNCWRVFWMWNIFRVYLSGRKLFNKKGGNRLIFQSTLMFSLQLIYTLLFSFFLPPLWVLCVRSQPSSSTGSETLVQFYKFQT